MSALPRTPKTDVDRIAYRRRTWLNSYQHQLGWLLVFNSKFLRVNEAHRSASSLRQRIDHPPPPRSDRKSRVVWIMSTSLSAARTFFRATLPLSDIWLAKPTGGLAVFVRPGS